MLTNQIEPCDIRSLVFGRSDGIFVRRLRHRLGPQVRALRWNQESPAIDSLPALLQSNGWPYLRSLCASTLLMERAYSIADDYDPDGDMPADTDPMAASLTYLEDVRLGGVGDMGFTLDDFKRYIAGRPH